MRAVQAPWEAYTELVERGEGFAISGLRLAEGASDSAQTLRMSFRWVARSSAGGLRAFLCGKRHDCTAQAHCAMCPSGGDAGPVQVGSGVLAQHSAHVRPCAHVPGQRRRRTWTRVRCPWARHQTCRPAPTCAASSLCRRAPRPHGPPGSQDARQSLFT